MCWLIFYLIGALVSAMIGLLFSLSEVKDNLQKAKNKNLYEDRYSTTERVVGTIAVTIICGALSWIIVGLCLYALIWEKEDKN